MVAIVAVHALTDLLKQDSLQISVIVWSAFFFFCHCCITVKHTWTCTCLSSFHPYGIELGKLVHNGCQRSEEKKSTICASFMDLFCSLCLFFSRVIFPLTPTFNGIKSMKQNLMKMRASSYYSSLILHLLKSTTYHNRLNSNSFS